MEREFKVGDAVIYVDPFGVKRAALVTIWWNIQSYTSGNGMPGCNLVFVSNDPLKQDSYGTQLERDTSVLHKSYQEAPGRYWMFADEV